jgi:predicted N-acyltransferase
MLVGVPFTPVTGHRFITAPGEDRPQLIQFGTSADEDRRRQQDLFSA